VTTLKVVCNCQGPIKLQQNRSCSFLSNRVGPELFRYNRRPVQIQQVVSYYEKKKEKSGGPSATILASISGVACGALIAAIMFLGQLEEGQEDIYTNAPTVLGYIYRARDRLHELKDFFVEPSDDILLPDPLQPPLHQPRYTLVIELTDVLVHPEYDRASGWRYQKRPGVTPFLKALTYPLFEIVIYTHENGFNAAPVCEAIDPEGDVMYRLFRNATKYMNGTHVKDLSKLNRDIRKVILLDCTDKSSQLQPRNSLVLKKWQGDTGDISLLELIPFFHHIASSGIEDVRDVLDYYRNEEDPVATFRQRQDALRKQQEELLQQQNTQQQRSSLFGGFLGRR